MKKINVIINPFICDSDEPGKFFELSVIVPDQISDGDLERKILDKIRYSIKSTEEYKP